MTDELPGKQSLTVLSNLEGGPLSINDLRKLAGGGKAAVWVRYVVDALYQKKLVWSLGRGMYRLSHEGDVLMARLRRDRARHPSQIGSETT